MRGCVCAKNDVPWRMVCVKEVGGVMNHALMFFDPIEHLSAMQAKVLAY